MSGNLTTSQIHNRDFFLQQRSTYAIQILEWALIPPFWILSTYFFIKIRTRSTIHPNMKVLLTVFPLACIAFQFSHNMGLLIVLDRDLRFMKPAMLHLGALHMVGNILMASNLQSFVVERYFAYKYMKTYEHWGSRLAWTMVIVTTVIAMAFCYFIMIYGYQTVTISEENGPLSIFEYMLESMPILPVITIPPCAFGAVFLAMKVRTLHKQNQAIHSNRFDCSLSTKATVNETYLFLPGLLLLGYVHTGTAITYYTLGAYRIYRILSYGEADVFEFMIQQLQHIVVEAYGFFFMLYNFHTMPALRRALYEDFFWLFGKGEDINKTMGPGNVVNDENGDARFKHLVNMWDQNYIDTNK